MNPTKDTLKWCDQCEKFTKVTTERELISMQEIKTTECCADCRRKDMENW